MVPVILLGHTGNYADMIDILDDINDAGGANGTRYELLGFLTNREESQGKSFHGYPVLGHYADAHRFPQAMFSTTTGGGVAGYLQREQLIADTGISRQRFLTLVHPTSYVSRRARLGHGVVIYQNCTIANSVTLGDHVLVLPNAVISHDDVIGDYTVITGSVAISGLVTVGRSCYLGTSCSIHHNIKIGDGCLIGMGSVIRHDVPPYHVMVGNPARVLREVSPPES